MPAQRIKDASFLQQHIEKLILAAGLLVFVVAVFLFVLGNPFAIEVNRQTYTDPGEAVNVLVRGDEQLKRGLLEPKPLPKVETPDFGANFIAMMQRPIDLERVVADMSDPGPTRRDLYPIPPKTSRYALVYPPAPKNITFKSGNDVLDKDFDPKLTAALFELWGKDLQEPGDFTMFVAAGEFDVWEWITRLKANPTGDEEIKIPTGIWAQRFGVAGVALLREELDPITGQWTNRQIVVPIPGQKRVLPDDKAETETTRAIAQLTALRDSQVELAQPELPWLTDFVQVAPPGNEGDGSADGLLQALDDQNLGKAEKEILKLEEKIKDLEERRAKRKERPGGNPRPGAGPDGFDGPAAGGERRDPLARQIESLRERITRLRPQAMKEEENRKKLAEARRIREEERARRDALRDERDRALAGPRAEDPLDIAGVPGMQIKEGSSLRVWAADPSMQPGKTYRYKLLVSVINPLYAVPRLAPDQLEENKQRAALLPTDAEIAAMPWIGPIKVEPKSRFFFTGGAESRANIDIYRRHNGELRVQEFVGAPGDEIGSIMDFETELGEIEEIDMGVDAILVDVEKRRDLLSNRTVYTLIYSDAQGNIFERTDVFDKSSPDLKDLRQEKKDGPDRVLRPDPDAKPGTGGPGGFEPGFDDF